MTHSMDFLSRLLSTLDKHEAHDLIWWRCGEVYGGGQYNTPATFLAKCSDVFWWGTADCEEITEENIGVLEQACADLAATGVPAAAACHSAELFAARVRGMRPQGAAYPTDPALWPLFDACGPERETGLGNPKPHPSMKAVNTGPTVVVVPATNAGEIVTNVRGPD